MTRLLLGLILSLVCGIAIPGEREERVRDAASASAADEEAKKKLLRQIVSSREKPTALPEKKAPPAGEEKPKELPAAAPAAPASSPGPAPGELRPLRSGAASSPERITSFDVDLTVNPDSTVTILERIQVAVQGNRIKKGIVRIIPIDHRTADGGVHRTDITLLSTTLDGKPVPNAVKRSGGNFSLVLGDVAVTLTHGIHTYEIRYKASGHIRFLEDRDAIYYNVTGNFWELDIDEASFRAHLPEGAKVVASNAYTGKKGESGADFTKDGDLFFLTTRPLAQGEGLTAAVDWSKGVVTPPPSPPPPSPSTPTPREPPSEWETWVNENRDLSLWGFAVAVLGYFGPAWLIFGRRKRRGTVIPLFYPPKDMDPGEAAALKQGEAGSVCFGADVVQLAVKGHVKIASLTMGFNLVETEPPPEKNEETKLSSGLAALKRDLFAGGTKNDAGEVTVNSGRDRSIVADAYNYSQARYKSFIEYMFDKNYGISTLGIVLFCMYTLAIVSARWYFVSIEKEEEVRRASSLAFLVVVGGGISLLSLIMLKGNLIHPNKALFRIIGGGIAFLVGLANVAPCLEGDYVVVFLLGAAAIAAFFLYLMPRRTRECEEKMTEIEGLEMYVKAAEEDRLAIVNAPEDTVEQYERLLPYAIALGCADAWEQRFAAVLEKVNYRPVWAGAELRNDRGFYSRRLGDVGASASRAAAEAIRQAELASRAATKSGGGWWSGGGGSGGGSSGGGSGGGGGGGW